MVGAGRKSFDQNRAGSKSRHKRDGLRRNLAMRTKGTHVVPTTYVVPEKGIAANEHDEAREFSEIIVPFSRGELASAGKRGKDAAKRWKEGQVLPSAWAMMHLARNIPSVRAYMASKMGIFECPEFLDPQAMTVMMAALYRLSAEHNPDGEAARALLARIASRAFGRQP